jgi:hypothetical protein
MLVGQMNKKFGIAVNALRQENLPACSFGYMCQRFTIPALYEFLID